MTSSAQRTDSLAASLHDLMHELREFNRVIKSKSERLTSILIIEDDERQLVISAERVAEARAAASTILATGQLISLRLNLIDYETNPERFAREQRFSTSVYGKFAKARLMLMPRASERHVKIKMLGESFKQKDLYPAFDLVPFILLDNAVKYAPSHSIIEIRISETSREIEVTVESLGPKVDEDEICRLTEKGYRGRGATIASDRGSGLGLNFADYLCRLNGITLKFWSGGSEWGGDGGVTYAIFKANVRVPL